MTLTVWSVVGTRPNFIKLAPVIAELPRFPETFSHLLIHTGQHYDAGYLEFMGLMMGAGAVLTDSGGVQAETTFLWCDEWKPGGLAVHS